LVLNNSSVLQIYFNKVSSMDVLVTFSPSSITSVYLNDNNFEMITFLSGTESRHLEINDNVESNQDSTPDMYKLEYYNLQYVY